MDAPAPPRRLWPMLLAFAALGLALRIANARGGLWLDEAWSATFARDVATPAGVLLSIHHDNSHHLNTLWMQLVGPDAPPLIQRALSIACGAGAILVAGAIAARRGIVAAGATAALFAVSPILVTYGSEARGYAPMVLALLAAILIADRWLDDRTRPAPALGLAIVCALGMFAQLTMAFGVAAVVGWVGLRVLCEEGLAVAIRTTLRLMVPALAVTIGLGLLIVVILPGAGGFAFGLYQPFTFHDFVSGVSAMIAYTFGIAAPVPILPLAALLLTVAAIALMPLGRRALYALAIVAFPLALAVLQAGNAAAPRYYLLAAVALLLLAGETFAATRGRWRIAGAIALAAVLGASLWRDLQLIADLRGDPSYAIAAMAQRAPTGATVAIDRPRASAVLEANAAIARYPLRVTDCGRFLFADRDGAEVAPASIARCGAIYRPIASHRMTGLSGTHWTLYERAP